MISLVSIKLFLTVPSRGSPSYIFRKFFLPLNLI